MTTDIAGAAQPAGEHGLTTGEYITHHLHHNASHLQRSIIDFSIVHYDTLFWSILLATVAALFLWAAARRARNSATRPVSKKVAKTVLFTWPCGSRSPKRITSPVRPGNCSRSGKTRAGLA